MTSISATRILAICLLLAVSPSSQAVLAAPVEDKDYFALNPSQSTSDPTKIVVTEFFSYQCPHCYSFAEPFAAWSKTLPPDVTAERLAVSIGHATWVPMAQAYYALKAMNAVPALDDAIFTAIHREGAKLVNESSIAAWLGKQGVSQTEFTKYYRSFSIQLNTKRADELSRSHRLPSVPVLVIDGKYMVRISDNGKFDDQLKIVNYLVDKERQLRASAKRGR
jgi:protein dithiol oxidoreductase (disulfide-forming)